MVRKTLVRRFYIRWLRSSGRRKSGLPWRCRQQVREFDVHLGESLCRRTCVVADVHDTLTREFPQARKKLQKIGSRIADLDACNRKGHVYTREDSPTGCSRQQNLPSLCERAKYSRRSQTPSIPNALERCTAHRCGHPRHLIAKLPSGHSRTCGRFEETPLGDS
jgi:hypothetical protein